MDHITYHGLLTYCGFSRNTEVLCQVIDRGSGAGETKCLECGGTGKWPWYPDPALADMDCVDCKGTGQIFVSIW